MKLSDLTVVAKIEDRLTLPGDSETVISQKTLAAGVTVIGATATAINGVVVLANGLTAAAISLFLLAAALIIIFAVLLLFPRYFVPITLVALVVTLLLDVATHVLSGGFGSGSVALIWIVLVPLLAFLIFGRRFAVAFAIIFAMAVIVAGWLEPFAVSIAPPVDPVFLRREAAYTVLLLGLFVSIGSLYLFSQVERYRKRADDLLLNILPGSIAARLKEDPGTIADGFSEATVLFADIVDFTRMSADADPVAVVQKLNEVFSEIDDLAERHGLEKIKTIGDAYMVCGGLPEPRPGHCRDVAEFALEMLQAVGRHRSWQGEPMRVRVGINTGPVVAGVIGRRKFIYDLWGDAVNVASRMESNGVPGEIQVTEAVRQRLEGQYRFEARGPIEVKGKGQMVTYLLSSP